tara:strand:- start:3831 stop:4775 length:945 start_codon:yes stop_codon:yes gene_type:complete
MTLSKSINRSFKIFSKTSYWEKIFYIAFAVLILLIINNCLNNYIIKEGFEQSSEFVVKKGNDVYDTFYVEIYDDLVFNGAKNDFEINSIIKYTNPTKKSNILDIGSGTGHHVKAFSDAGYNTQGIDISPDMVKISQKNYPKMDYQVVDALKPMSFPPNSFTHINCLYFTIYYIENKHTFFQNCFNWLIPGGYLSIHLVDKENFDPIIPAGDPFNLVSPQKYTKKRITSTVVKFDQFDYKSKFELLPNNRQAVMNEIFKDKKNGAVRKNEHKFFMPNQKKILSTAKDVGFLLKETIDMIKCQYTHQYIYILKKPN